MPKIDPNIQLSDNDKAICYASLGELICITVLNILL